VDWKWPEATLDWEKCYNVCLANWWRDCPQYMDDGPVEELIRRFRLPFDPYREDNDTYVRKVLACKE
jgi:hypothetical protein